MEFEHDYNDVIHFTRDLLLCILQGLETRYTKQTERVRKEYKTEPFLVPKKSEDVPILTFREGVAMLKAAGTEISELEDIK
jgi:aspartyl-tRNA synthetase